MKKVFIIANWKSNLTMEAAKKWFEEESSIEVFITHVLILKDQNRPQSSTDELEKEVILCPSFTLLLKIKELIEEKKLPFKLGAQNLSPFGPGAYTGEVNAQQVKELADYVIIGHSERRNNFGETETQLKEKVKQALAAGLTPIFCVQNEATFVPEGVKLVAYEPPTAIGTGNPDTPENAEKIAEAIKNKYKDVEFVLYGGSVTSENIRNFVQMEHLNGALIGGASLDPVSLAAIIKKTSL